jgi:hypothetical protein
MNHYDEQAELSLPLNCILDPTQFPIVEVDPVECARRDLTAWQQDSKQARPADLYRKWSKRLRELDNDPARAILRDIQLECTMPFNELESPHWLDGYTGEIISDDNCYHCNQPIPLDMKTCPNCEAVVISGAPIQLPDWQHFLVTRFPDAYPDEDVREQAMKASSQWVGVEEEMYILEDRGYEPPTFTESMFTTDELNFMRLEIELLAAALRKRISIEAERATKQKIIQNKVRSSDEALNYLTMCQNMIDRGEVPQDVFMLVRPFTHGYGFLEVDWSLLYLPTDPFPQWALPQLGNKQPTLYDWAIEYEDMINMSEEATPLEHSYTSEEEIRDIAEKFLQELIDVVPVEGDRSPLAPNLNPIMRSRYYVEGFIRAQINSAPNPALEAWSYWRKQTSPAGSLAYEKVLKTTDNRKRAMSAFWQAAIIAGDVTPTPKKIAALKPTGLELSNGRTVSWSTAIKIATSEGFQDEERLVAVLKEHKLGLQLVKVLEAK